MNSFDLTECRSNAKSGLPSLLLCTLFLLSSLASGNAQTVSYALDTLLTRTLDSMFNVLKPVGFSAAVQLPNGAIWTGAKGVSEKNPTVEITPDYVFGIGSVHKTLTAASILKLADEGVLSLDDSLHKWVDTFNFINPNISIRQLLRHQSGIYDVIGAPTYQQVIGQNPDSIWTWTDMIKTFIKAPIFAPGASWSYSNTNYLLLGIIIENATGKPYHQVLSEQFLTPLELNSMVLPPYEPFPAQVAHLWLDLNGDAVPDDADYLFAGWNSWYSTAAPAGSYFSTPADMAHWMRTYMSGSLLSPAMMDAMKMTVNTPLNGGTKYGLGIMQRQIGGLTGFGHGGDAGYSASVWYFPTKDVSVAVLNNDGRKNSWTLIPTVTALLKAYSNYAAQTIENQDVIWQTMPMSVYPNPFSTELSLAIDLPEQVETAQFILIDALGRQTLVAERKDLNAGTQDLKFEQLDSLQPGVYYLTANLDGKLVGQKLLVKKA